MIRKIIHIDMDAFYASVEQRDNVLLKGKPVAVGQEGYRGVVAAASYEARVFGVRSAMASTLARRLCPNLIFIPPRGEVYRIVSRDINHIFTEFTDLIEPVSLDEAYLDVTHPKLYLGSGTAIAEVIRRRIWQQTGLTASAGVSYNKFLAKIASRQNKPNGIFVIPPRLGQSFILALPIEAFHGVGTVTARKMYHLGIRTGKDLYKQDLTFLLRRFGKLGQYLFDIVRAQDNRPVVPDQLRKSLGTEKTFTSDLYEFAKISRAIRPIYDKAWRMYKTSGLKSRTVTIKVKYTDFQIITRQKSFPYDLVCSEEVKDAVLTLLRPLCLGTKGIRLLGVTLSGFNSYPSNSSSEKQQLSFF